MLLEKDRAATQTIEKLSTEKVSTTWIDNDVYTYQAFGMLIQSEIPLPLPKNNPERIVSGSGSSSSCSCESNCQEQASACSGDGGIERSATSGELHQVSIKMGKVHSRPQPHYQPEPQSHSLGTIRYTVCPEHIQIQVHIPQTGTFLIENMQSITVEPYPGADEKNISLCLTVLVLPFLLRRKPVITLHGSAVVTPAARVEGNRGVALCGMEPSAAILIGAKGTGKSTTAAALTKYGWKLLCDDLVPVEPGPNVLPGIPLVKLLPDAFQVLAGDPDTSAHLFDGVSKYLADTPITPYAAKLGTLYILHTGSVSSVQIEPLTGQEKIGEIIAHTIRIDGLDTPAEIFQRVTEYFGSVKTYRVTRPEVRPRARSEKSCSPEKSCKPRQIAEAILASLKK